MADDPKHEVVEEWEFTIRFGFKKSDDHDEMDAQRILEKVESAVVQRVAKLLQADPELKLYNIRPKYEGVAYRMFLGKDQHE